MDLGKEFDLAAEAGAGAWLTLRSPKTDESLPVCLKVLGKDSAHWQRVLDDESAKRLKKERNGNQSPVLTPEQQRSALYRMLSELVTEWQTEGQPYLEVDGQQLGCTTANVRLVFNRLPWIAMQVSEFAEDPANFGREASESAAILPYVATLEKNSLPGLSGDSANPAVPGQES
jgi:hypothetical protein